MIVKVLAVCLALAVTSVAHANAELDLFYGVDRAAEARRPVRTRAQFLVELDTLESQAWRRKILGAILAASGLVMATVSIVYLVEAAQPCRAQYCNDAFTSIPELLEGLLVTGAAQVVTGAWLLWSGSYEDAEVRKIRREKETSVSGAVLPLSGGHAGMSMSLTIGF